MTEKTKSYDSAVIKKMADSRVEITGSIPVEVWGRHRTQALKNINESVTVDGFRKGMIPENILVAKVGEMAILEEIAELALSKAYIDIILDNNIDAIGKPEIKVTKLAKDNPLEFTATTAAVPELKLPDYKKIVGEIITKSPDEDTTATDKDIEDAILRLRKAHASHEGHDHEKMTPEEHDKAIMANLPEFNDEFVKKLGDFKDVADFKNKASEIISDQKKDKAREKLRISIADAIEKATQGQLPDIMIESELNRTQAQFSADIERMGVKLEDYLKHAKKTVEDLRKEWHPHAEKKAKLQLILNEIAKIEKIKPDQKEIETEANHILAHYKDADKERAMTYAETVLTNEKVFQFLEKC